MKGAEKKSVKLLFTDFFSHSLPFLHFYSLGYLSIIWGADSAKVLQISSQNSGRSKAAFSSSQSKIIPTNKHL